MVGSVICYLEPGRTRFAWGRRLEVLYIIDAITIELQQTILILFNTFLCNPSDGNLYPFTQGIVD